MNINEEKITTQNAFIGSNGKPFDWSSFASAIRKSGWRQMGNKKRFGYMFIKRYPSSSNFGITGNGYGKPSAR